MRGKRRILSLALVLALVVQLFSSLSNVAQAGSATEIKVTGLGGWSGSYAGTGTEQIGFAIQGTITNGDSWVNCTITDGQIQRNGVSEAGWRIQTTGASNFVLVLDGYNPASGDVIKIPAGMQFTRNGTSDVYKITDECSIQYDGSKWNDVADGNSATQIKVTGLGGWSASASGNTPEQIGFTIDGTIVNGDSWLNCTISNGQIERNNVAEAGWRIQTTGASSFVLVRDGYAPVEGDIIKIPAGTQITRNGTTDIYEVTNEYTIQYEGTTWVKYVPTTPLTLGELNDATSRIVEGGQGLVYQICIATNQTETTVDWTNGTDTTAEVYLNDTTTPINATVLWNTSSGELFVQLDLTKDTVVNKVTIKKGTQYTILGTIYEVTSDDYTVYCYDNDLHDEPKTEPTPLTLEELQSTSRVVEGGQGLVYQIRIATNLTGTKEDWYNTDITAEVLLNGENEINATALWSEVAGELFVQLDLTKDTAVDSVTIQKGTQYTIQGIEYDIQNDYTVYYYDGSFHTSPKVVEKDPIIIKINGRSTIFDVTASGTTPEQIGFAIDQTIIGGDNWFDCLITQGNVLLNDVAQSGWKIQTTGAKTFNLVCWNYKATAGDIIKIPAGTQFACDGNIYEIKEDYAIKYDGTNWGVFVKADKFIKISDRYPNFDANATDTIPEQIGFKIKETITDGDKWIDCIITYGTVLMNGSGQNGWKIQTTGTNTFNLVCWNYKPTEKDIMTIPADTQFTCNGTVYEITEEISTIYHNGEWVVDDVKISYKGEELVEGVLYGLRIGSTKQQVEALFAAVDGIQRDLAITFTYPKEMFDADNIFQTGTYEIVVSATSYSGSKAEYKITVKGFTKEAPTISYEGETELMADAGKEFDVSVLNAVAKDGNGKQLKIQYEYSDGALDSVGALKKGKHVLYLVAVDDEGQSFTRKIKLTCYEMTDIVIKGFYIQFDEELFIATNMKNPEKFKISGIIPTDDIRINGKSGVITWITVDEHSGSLYMLIEPKKGDILTIEGGTTFLDHKNYIGIRTLNSFKGHTDGIGWIKDRLPNNGFGTTASPNSPAIPLSPTTGDNTPWIMYAGLCILLLPIIIIYYKKRRFGYEEK